MVLDKNELGKLIKEARKHKAEMLHDKYTQAMLAEEIGISRSYLGDYEAGRRYPKYDVLAKIAEACGVGLTFFGENKEEETKNIYYNDPMILPRLPEDLQKFVEGEKNTPHLVVAASYIMNNLSETEMKFLVDWLKMAIKETNNNY